MNESIQESGQLPPAKKKKVILNTLAINKGENPKDKKSTFIIVAKI